ncbi:peptidylprolyl isomerase [uncultured Polaribacter sp.]|uniref:FKBP-type peptidyl-prolyl cis-trans isomerase n=1 Tax=uncultured Polaribacter sp. TaxID=174711 RepID=UPI0032B177B8
MNKIKHIFLLLLLGVVLIYSCDDDNNTFVNPFADINHLALSISDNDSIVQFLKNNYYDVATDSVKTLVSGEIALYDQKEKLTIMDAKRYDLDYKLYIYHIKEGNPIHPDFGEASDDKGNPTIADSIYAKYSGQSILSSSELSAVFDSNTSGNWFSYERLAVRGWSFGFTNLKAGYLKKEDNGDTFNGPITYLEGGKSIFFIPSGLSYTSINPNNYASTLVNQNLMFKVELLDFVQFTDHDNDGRPSSEEDANEDGDLENDFNDNSQPGVPDYLNRDI